MKKLSFEDALILKTTKTARFLARVLPRHVWLGFLWSIGGLVYLFSRRRQVAIKNLRAAFAQEKSRGELRRIARRSIQNMAVSLGEMLCFPEMNLSTVRRDIRFEGLEKFEPYLSKQQGLIFLTAHFGNWELLNVTASVLGYPMVVLARTQKHPRSDAYLNSFRSCKGSQVIRKGMPVREILRSLKNGKVVGILSDQDGGKNGTFVRFFGRLSSTPSGVITFAMRTGAPIFPTFGVRLDWKRHQIDVKDALVMPDPATNSEEAERIVLQQFASVLEQEIRKNPDQWLWAHRRWKSTPDRSIVILSDGKTGHLNQSLAVLEAIKEERRESGLEHTHAHVVSVKFKNKFLEKLFNGMGILFRGHLPFGYRWMRFALEAPCLRELMTTYADVVISCGSSLAVLNRLVQKENSAKSLVVMRPPFCEGFDAVIVPRHDGVSPAKNIFATDRALSFFSGPYLEKEAGILRQDLGDWGDHKKVGLLIGGDTKELKFSQGVLRGVLEALNHFISKKDALIFATSSRRTPRWADALLKETFRGSKKCPLLVLANEANRPGVVAGILGSSDVIVVSGESISMISEAVASGKPVLVFAPSKEKSLKPKFQRFLDHLASEKQIFRVSAETIAETIEHQLFHTNGTGAADPSHDWEVLRQAVRRVL